MGNGDDDRVRLKDSEVGLLVTKYPSVFESFVQKNGRPTGSEAAGRSNDKSVVRREIPVKGKFFKTVVRLAATTTYRTECWTTHKN